MLKKCLLIMLLATVLLLPAAANAASATVTTWDELVAAVADTTVDQITISGTLPFNSTVSIEREITISGGTLLRDAAFTKTLFKITSTGDLTLDGVTIDGNNNWTFDNAKYTADFETVGVKFSADENTYVQPVSGAPAASAYMITNSGSLSIKGDSVIKNHYSASNGLISAAANSTVTLEDTTITHCASKSGSGLVVNASGAGIQVTMKDGTIIDDNFVGGNHGIFKVYSGTVLTMEGGEVKNTKGWNSNGIVVGVYNGTFNMSGGLISNNSSVCGSANGRNAAIYLHNNSVMNMSGGEISGNPGRSRGGIDGNNNSAQLNVTGGKVVNNTSLNGNTDADVGGSTAGFLLSGGTYSHLPPKEIIAEGYVARNNGNGTWTVIPISELPKNNVTPGDAPKTGDSTQLAMLFGLAVISLMGIVWMGSKQRKAR